MSDNTKKVFLGIGCFFVGIATITAIIYNDNKKHPANFQPTRFNLKKESCVIDKICQNKEDVLEIFLSKPIDCYSVKYCGNKMFLNTFTYTNNPDITSINIGTVKDNTHILEISVIEENSKAPKRKDQFSKWELI